MLVEHTVSGRRKVMLVIPPHFVAHFPSLDASERGPRRRLQLTAPQIATSSVQSDPALDGLALEPKTKNKTHGAKSVKDLKPALYSLTQAIACFESQYPKRFSDSRPLDTELRYEQAAHKASVRETF